MRIWHDFGNIRCFGEWYWSLSLPLPWNIEIMWHPKHELVTWSTQWWWRQWPRLWIQFVACFHCVRIKWGDHSHVTYTHQCQYWWGLNEVSMRAGSIFYHSWFSYHKRNVINIRLYCIMYVTVQIIFHSLAANSIDLEKKKSLKKYFVLFFDSL